MSESLNAQEITRAIVPDPARLLGPGDVARWLRVSPGWVRDHATRKQPRIKAVKIGKLMRFRAEDVEDLFGNGISEAGIAPCERVSRNGRTGVERVDVADTFTETIRAAVREELAAFSGHVQKRVYTLAEAAQYLGMSEEALRNKVNRNQIPCVRVDTDTVRPQEPRPVDRRKHTV